MRNARSKSSRCVAVQPRGSAPSCPVAMAEPCIPRTIVRAGLAMPGLVQSYDVATPESRANVAAPGRFRLGRRLRVGEYVLRCPASEVEAGAIGQEPEAGRRQFLASLARQQRIELSLEGVQMQHVGGRIGDLGVGQVGRTPVGKLLLLRQVDAE